MDELTPALAQKIAMRDRLLTARRRLSLLDLQEAAQAIAGHLLATPEVRRAATVAAYVSVGTEPGTGPLLEALLDAGRRVLLPVVLPDLDLDWAVHTGTLRSAGRGLLEPVGPTLGPEAVATADVVLTPGLAVDRSGMRLGRGGGSYDRALGRVPVGTFTCTLLHEGELVDFVPAEPHDRPVAAAVTPSGVTPFASSPG
ncbi:5-formyltetrahydrofolate cyclo-ligase [Nocardioides caldifontis]|uniref:5-formyltetrahydrofolate cyclo-ligase n=1 Tax=Nocardioides caldifontis TaxID=2588938 RepID=UPI001EEFE19D|nr:5-formyltetrahydrofolate cyclo-ligase [Nocardioides caldifontis]